MVDSYFVSYFSNQSSKYFKENKSYKFNVFLPQETFFPRELTQKKIIVGLKALSFQFTNDANNPSIIGLKSSLIDPSNKTDDQILFMTQVNPSKKVQYFSVSHPLYFVTNRQSLATPSFEFTSYNSESGKFEALTENILREDIIVHVRVEIKAVDTSMNLQHFNVLVSSSDKESAQMFPDNKPYDFTILKRFEFRENEKWVMGLKSLIIPSLIQNAELPDFGISYKLEMIPKDRQLYLPYVETYSGSLPQKHFETVDHFFTCLSEMLKKISIIDNAFKVEDNNKLKVADPLYLLYKASLLKRPPPPPVSPPPQVEIGNIQESSDDEDMEQPGDIPLPSPDANELVYMDQDENNVEQDRIDVEPGDIDLPAPDADELGTMVDQDEDNVEQDRIDVESEEEEEEMEEEADRERNEIQKDNKETPMEVQDNKTLKRTRSEDDDDEKNIKKKSEDNESNEIQKDDTPMEVQDNKTPKRHREESKEENEEITNNNKIQKEGEGEQKRRRLRKKKKDKKDKKEKKKKKRKTRSVEDTVDAGGGEKWDNALDYTMAKEILANDVVMTHLFFPMDMFELDADETFANDKVKEAWQLYQAKTKATHTFKLHFELSKMLAKMFGISEENRSIQVTDDELYDTYEKAYCQGTEETNLNFGIPQTILLNCDLIEESLVGNKKLPLLKHIFLGDKVLERDRQHQFNFNIDQWYEVKMKNTSKFNLRVTDLLGNQISLQEDQHKLSTIVELIFKKVNHEYNY